MPVKAMRTLNIYAFSVMTYENHKGIFLKKNNCVSKIKKKC
jgi:hypothetical protein